MTVDYDLAERVVAFLNELLQLDRPAIAALTENRIPCNQEIANHPTCQVGSYHGGLQIGLLGVLNGLCGIDELGRGAIEAMFESRDGFSQSLDLKGFRLVFPPDVVEP